MGGGGARRGEEGVPGGGGSGWLGEGVGVGSKYIVLLADDLSLLRFLAWSA